MILLEDILEQASAMGSMQTSMGRARRMLNLSIPDIKNKSTTCNNYIIIFKSTKIEV